MTERFVTLIDGKLKLDNVDLSAIAEFESFSAPQPDPDDQQTTTSNGWVTVSGYPYTTTGKTIGGEYIINFTALVGNSDKEKRTGSRIQYREGTSGSWITLIDVRNAVSVDDGEDLRTGFVQLDPLTLDEFQVRYQFGQTDDGGTGTIRQANITISLAS